MSNERFDAIVIGAGHNGLVAAAYLARAGLRVCVVERRDIVGGACVTEDLSAELGPEWKGVGVHTGAYVCSLFHPQIIEDLQLRKHGLEIYRRETSGLALFPNGEHLFLFPDSERTRAELQRFCPQDVDAYFTFDQEMNRAATQLEPYFLSSPNDDKPATLQEFARKSARDILDARFRNEGLKAVLSTDGVIGTFGGPSTAGTGYVLLHHYMGRVMGPRALWGHVRGGMGALTRALADAVRAAGGVVRTGSAVERIVVKDGRAEGVELGDGTRLTANHTLSNADARRTFLKLVGEQHLPSDFVADIKNLKMNGVSAKINLLVSELPEFQALKPQSSITSPQSPYLGTVHFVPTMDYIDEAFRDAQAGLPSSNPMVECTIQTASDPSLTSSGKHVISLFTQYFPYQLKPGLIFEEERERYADRVLDILCEHAPNLRKAIVGRHVLTPRDLEQRFGLTGGHIFHGDLLPGQIFERRPSGKWSRYRTPIEGLYLCGSSAHPGGCVSGLPGRNGALELLKDLKRASRNR